MDHPICHRYEPAVTVNDLMRVTTNTGGRIVTPPLGQYDGE
jgi:hypothetical protein